MKNFGQFKFCRTDFRDSIRLVQFQMFPSILDFKTFFLFDDEDNYIIKEIRWSRIKSTELMIQIKS